MKRGAGWAGSWSSRRCCGSAFAIAVVTTQLSLIISYLLAMFLARLKGQTKTLAVVVRTFVWLPMLGRTGLVNQFVLALASLADRLTGCRTTKARSTSIRCT